MNFILSVLIVGIIIVPVLMIFCCLGFCCGRECGKCCKCCCQPCRQPHCGGKIPTRKYGKMETLVVLGLLLPACAGLALAFSGVGFGVLLELNQDLAQGLDGVNGILTTPQEMVAKLDTDIATLRDGIKSELRPLNDAFASVDKVKQGVRSLRKSLQNLQASMRELTALQEGCKPGTDCSVASKVTYWEACPGSRGTTPTLSSGLLNPVCLNANGTVKSEGCPCCQNCQARLQEIDNTLAKIPTDSDMDALNAPLPMDTFNSKVTTSLSSRLCLYAEY
jgi:hypothetical protein